jgi:Flp pilus assembly protein TadD
MKGRAQGKLGNMQEKADLTRKAIELDPKIPAYYRNLGAALYKLKQY